MEAIIAIAGSMAIVVMVAIAVAFAYMLLSRYRTGRASGEPRRTGLKKCPLCGGIMTGLRNAPHVIGCTTPKCPNYQAYI